MTDWEWEYRRKQNSKALELLRKDKWTDADRLEYLMTGIRPYSPWWRMGMIRALRRAIKLLREAECKAIESEGE